MRINDIFIGVNAIDYSGYPDCRKEFINGFENLINSSTKEGINGVEFGGSDIGFFWVSGFINHYIYF